MIEPIGPLIRPHNYYKKMAYAGTFLVILSLEDMKVCQAVTVANELTHLSIMDMSRIYQLFRQIKEQIRKDPPREAKDSDVLYVSVDLNLDESAACLKLYDYDIELFKENEIQLLFQVLRQVKNQIHP